MIELSTYLVIHMFISLIYTEFVFGGILCNAEKRKIHTGKNVYEIIRDILLDEGLWGEIKIDMSPDRKAYESFYVEKSRTIQLSDADGTAQAVGTAIHECGHAVQYNKSVMMKKVIRVRDALKKFCLPDMVSPLAVLFFDGFCTPLYIVFSFFLLKLIARILIELFVEIDANLRILKYIKKHISNPEDRRTVKKFLAACSLTYLSTLN